MLEVRNVYTPQGLNTAINCKKRKIAELTQAIYDAAHRKQSEHPSYARFSEKEFLGYKIKTSETLKRCGRKQRRNCMIWSTILIKDGAGEFPITKSSAPEVTGQA